MIYLDNHATTPLDGRVLDAMMPYLTDQFGNASSVHRYGFVAGVAVEQARQEVAQTIHANPSEVYFTSGATESNNTIIKGVYFNSLRTKRNLKPHFIFTTVEHKCVLEAARYIEQLGADVTFIGVNEYGELSVKELQAALRPSTVLASVMLANNEIGTINPIKDLADICHSNNTLLHTDAAQTIGKIRVDVKALGVDFMSTSAHKHYGPKGMGILYVSNEAKPYVDPLLHGGGQEGNLRSGTKNTAGIVGLAESMRLFCNDSYIQEEAVRERELITTLYEGLKQAIPNLIVNGVSIGSANRLPNNLNVSFPSINEKLFNKKLKGLMISSGSACSSNDLRPSYVLMAMGRSEEVALKSFRFGISKNTQTEDIQEALDIFLKTYEATSNS
jgi:cysteine desulfurase